MFVLPKIDFNYNDLEPYIDSKTMEIHYTKHHQTYVDKLNQLVESDPSLEGKSLEELCLIDSTRNMAGGHFNHSFFWKILGLHENQNIPDVINNLKDEFNDKSLKLFGSGWVWIAEKEKKIGVISTLLQDSPLIQGYKPILGIDLWEHAYYLKYQNRRSEYVDAFWKVINWSKISSIINEIN